MPAMFKSNRPNSAFAIYGRLVLSAKQYWLIFTIGILATICGSGIDSTLAWLVKPIINKGFIEKDVGFIHWLPLLIVLVFVGRGVAGFVSNYFISRVGRSVVMDFRQAIFGQLMRLPATFYDQHSSGQILSTIIYNVEQVASATTDALLTVAREGFLVIGLLVVMFTISWRLSLLFLVIAPVASFVLKKNSQRLRNLSGSVQYSMADVMHIAEEAIEGYKVIRTFGGEQFETGKFNKATQVNRNREMKVVATNSIGTTAVQMIAVIPIVVILYLATSSSLGVSAGSFAAIVVAMMGLLTPLRRVTRVNSTIQKGIAGAHSIFNFIDQQTEKDNGTLRLQRAKGAVEFSKVGFSYPNTSIKVLDNISFKIEPGKTIALVGRSGSGKSTLVNLLPRFYDIAEGQIKIDGIDIHEYYLADLRNQFAFVSQQVVLFNDTIAANIAYGQFQGVSETDIIQAAEAAYAMNFIRDLPDGLNTMVGENGVLLSGGQRQRLAIARALLKDAPILILDEATSALDTESERHIQKALDKLMQQRTTLVIAHRLSTIENADLIMVLDKGRIIEIGTHQQLLAASRHYARLYNVDFATENEREIMVQSV